MELTLLHLLDWSIIAISFFNTIVLLWLGLTVLLNAERRAWGTWVAGLGLLFGGAFFAGHSAIVARPLGTFNNEMELWWRIGWLPFIAGPYLWYLVIAWYTGLLRARRHRAWLAVVSLLGATALALLAFGDPLPSYGEVVGRAPGAIFSIGGIPVAILVYPVYSVLCIVLALFALDRPASSERFMGDLARRRARPWLLAASAVLLLIGLAVGGAAAWVLVQLPGLSLRTLALFIGFDLLISGMIAVISILLGQAVVRYEVFTGKALPRGGLSRHWRRTLLLATGYGALVGGSLALPVPVDPVYHLLLATVLMTVFYALLSWRSYVDREQSMDRLRPFVASQRVYEQIVRPEPALDVDVAGPLRALSDDVLGARMACLAPIGPLAALIGPLVATAGDAGPVHAEHIIALARRFNSPRSVCVPVEPAHFGGAIWAAGLWNARGLIGVMLLGPKRDDGLYTEEEIEIARAIGERLIDTCASAEMARRLMALQRRRLAESQVVDRRTRRVLHDEVLPQIHAAMLTLDGARPTGNGTVALLADIHKQISDLLHAMPATDAGEISRIGLLGALRYTIDHELSGAFDRVTWDVLPEAERAARVLPPLVAEVGFYAIREVVRNAARHGRGADLRRPLNLAITIRPGTAAQPAAPGIDVLICDDGVGLSDASAPREGHGLALHSTLLAVVGGMLTMESAPGQGVRVGLMLPGAG